MTEDVKIEVEGCLVAAGELDGSMVKVAVTLDDLFEALDSQHLSDEVHERLGTGDEIMTALADAIGTEADVWPGDDDEDPLFKPLSDWDKDELRKAVREDDGRRAIDVLKRAAA